MTFLYIYIGFSLLTFALVWGQTIILERRLRKKHNLNKKVEADNLAFWFAGFKMFLMSFAPILNLILFCSVLFLSNRIEKEVTKQVEDRLEEEGYLGKETN